jgi:hypothetical protein
VCAWPHAPPKFPVEVVPGVPVESASTEKDIFPLISSSAAKTVSKMFVLISESFRAPNIFSQHV